MNRTDTAAELRNAGRHFELLPRDVQLGDLAARFPQLEDRQVNIMLDTIQEINPENDAAMWRAATTIAAALTGGR